MSEKYFKAGVRVVDMVGASEKEERTDDAPNNPHNNEFTRMGQKYGPELGRAASAIAGALYNSNPSEAKNKIAALTSLLREIEGKL